MKKIIFISIVLQELLNASYVLKPDNLVDFNSSCQNANYELVFQKLKKNIFNIIAKNINHIEFKKQHNKITSDIKFLKHINCVNLIWLLPDEFSDFVDEKYQIYALPKNNLKGEFSIILKIIKNNKIIREEAVSSNFKIFVEKH